MIIWVGIVGIVILVLMLGAAIGVVATIAILSRAPLRF